MFIELDLADLRSVRRAAKEFLQRESSLDVLFNNGWVCFGTVWIVADIRFEQRCNGAPTTHADWLRFAYDYISAHLRSRFEAELISLLHRIWDERPRAPLLH
jgi:NAD(P)-dependent dehydrogenase (short-subunit alcohol dehydrogenase family)